MEKRGLFFLLFLFFVFLSENILAQKTFEEQEAEDKQKLNESYTRMIKIAQEKKISLEFPLKTKEVLANKNAYKLYLQIFKHLEKTPISDEFLQIVEEGFSSTNKSLAEILQIIQEKVKANENTLRLLEQATQKEYAIFPLNYEEGFNLNLEHILPLKRCNRLLISKSFLEFHQKQDQKSLTTSLQAFRVSKGFAEDFVLISKLLEIHIQSFSLENLFNILPQIPYHSEVEKQILNEIQKYHAIPSFISACQGEFLLIFPDFELLRTEKLKKQAFFKKLQKGMNEETGLSGMLEQMVFLASWKMHQDITKFYDFYSYLFEGAQKNPQEFRKQIEKANVITQSLNEKEHFFSNLLLFSVARVWERFYEHQAYLNCAKVALLMRQYHHKTNRYPENLDELEKEFPNLPKDPMTQMPLKYKKSAEEILIYSVGLNLKEDQGKIEHSPSEEKKLDIGIRYSLK